MVQLHDVCSAALSIDVADAFAAVLRLLPLIRLAWLQADYSFPSRLHLAGPRCLSLKSDSPRSAITTSA